ncbi:MAG TPA: cob(I)yrinic acid a,c-diamide adenosyltransferase [Candidatus Saccharimonadia bacterium]|nr:cob(I)yrinic acid a,c-diamide adenosyltransferase [Candidatus Saccharimonadia bacterium]
MTKKEFKSKPSVVVVYTGEGKGKTSASLGLMVRGLGNRWNVAFVQFIKYWGVSEHIFLRDIQPLYKRKLFFYKGGKGFFNAKELSAENITKEQHKKAAIQTLEIARKCISSGKYDLVICDEINNALQDGLLTVDDLKSLIMQKSPKTNLCLTGRGFPKSLLRYVDIATDMTKIKHHYDDNFIANKGIDY